MTIDTGATASLISLDLCKLANITIRPANQKAVQADGHTQLQIIGEIDVKLHYPNIPPVHLEALVVPKLSSVLLAGMPFTFRNDIIIHTRNHLF